MTTDILSSLSFRDYAERDGFALFPLEPGTKDPRYGFRWADKPADGQISESSTDPEQWARWLSEGSNLAIYAGRSRLIIVDIDVKELGRDRAWALWCEWCIERGINAADYPAQVQTASLGWHIFFRIPAGCPPLSQRQLVGKIDGSKKAVVETRAANGYVVAPESYYAAGGSWTLISQAPPHPAPSALLDACSSAPTGEEVRSFVAHDGDGLFDFQEVFDACAAIEKYDGLSEEKAWCECVWAIRDYFGDKGYPLAEMISYCDDSNRLPSVWNRQTNKSAKPTTCATILFIAKQCRRDHMFDDVGAAVAKGETWSPSIVPDGAHVAFPPPSVGYDEESDTVEDAALALRAPQPFIWRDPRSIPMMPWIYGRHLLRGCVSLTVAPSGVGKTFEKVMETVAMVTGRMLLHDQPAEKLRCWFYNGEEPMEIIERRFHAAFLHHNFQPADIGDRLFVNDRTTKMVIAKTTRDGVTIVEPVKDLLIAYIRANNIDVLSIDPFVSAHAVTENDNVAIDQVVKAYADVAQETNIAIDLVHHARKTNGANVGIEDARGASAMIGAVRAARTMNFMSSEEATRAGIENRYQYVRIDDAKPNHAPRSEVAQWVKFQGVYLGNGPMGLTGDNVAAMVRWDWPDAMEGVTSINQTAVWDAVRAGRWRESVQAADWVGKPVAAALGLDLEKPADKAKVKAMVYRWIKSGELIKVEGLDDQRKAKVFIEVSVIQVVPHSAPPPPAHP